MKSPKSSDFTIREKQLVEALEITPQRLDEIIAILDADPHDEWELKENDHFIFVNQRWKERMFSQQGAFAVAKYMDSIEKTTIWGKIKEFITGHKAKIRNAFVRQKVQENCGSLTLKNNRHFLSKADVIRILCTSPARFNQAFKEIQNSSGVGRMEIDKDFTDIGDAQYYSLSGLDKISRNLSTTLKNKDRQAWCGAVEIEGSKTLKRLISEEAAKAKKIQSAMDAARKRDKSRCQITGQEPDKHNKMNMTVHHIFCKKHYSHLAMSQDNLVTLTEAVHREFHNWNGGFDKPCTIDDLIRFVNEQYPDSEDISIWLNQQKKVLGEQKAA